MTRKALNRIVRVIEYLITTYNYNKYKLIFGGSNPHANNDI